MACIGHGRIGNELSILDVHTAHILIISRIWCPHPFLHPVHWRLHILFDIQDLGHSTDARNSLACHTSLFWRSDSMSALAFFIFSSSTAANALACAEAIFFMFISDSWFITAQPCASVCTPWQCCRLNSTKLTLRVWLSLIVQLHWWYLRATTYNPHKLTGALALKLTFQYQ